MKYLIYLLLFSGIGLAQNLYDGSIDPCDDPLLILAETEGLKAVPVIQRMRLKKIIKACERQGGKEQIEDLYTKDWNRDYKRSRRMASWTSTHAMCVFVSFGYYFIGKIFAHIPSSE